MIRIEVVARTTTNGKVLPIRFRWEGKEFPVTGIGRRWQADDGEHILVMIPGDRVVELLLHPDNTWSFKPGPGLGKRWIA